MRKTFVIFGALALLAVPGYAANNFNPGETLTLTAGTAPASVKFALPKSLAAPDIMVSNAGGVTAFFGCDGSGRANLPGFGALNATPILPGAIMTFAKPPSALCAAVTASGSTVLYFTAGQGE